MKRIVLLFLIATSSVAKAQYVDILDANLANYLKTNFPSCVRISPTYPNNYQIDSTCTAIHTIDSLNLAGLQLGDLSGLEAFPSLKYLNCAYNFIGYSPLLPHLQYLNYAGGTFRNNSIFSDTAYIPPIPPSLVYLDVSGIGSKSLPPLPSSLRYLYCENNHLYSLSSLPTLIAMDCSGQTDVYDEKHSGHPSLQSADIPGSLKYLNCSQNGFSGFVSLPDSLVYLNCASMQGYYVDSFDNAITYPTLLNLPQLPNTLTYLDCSGNDISGFPSIANTSLVYLSCGGSKIGSFSAFPLTLKDLLCASDSLTGALPTLPPGLDSLDCSLNHLTSLPSFPAALKYLSCSSNQLSSLPSLPQQLFYLSCFVNSLQDLPAPLPDSLVYLNCESNQLTNLPVLPDKLSYLNCGDNKLSELPALSKSLTFLNCIANNNLSCLPVLPPTMANADTWNDPINPYDNNMNNLDFDGTMITCLPNWVNGMRSDTLPLCNPVNNSNHCHPHPVAYGRVFGDYNNNLIKDVNEFYTANVELQLANNLYSFTTDSGYYELTPDTIGNYTLKVIAPANYKAIPDSVNYSFTSYDTAVLRDIALQPILLFDSLVIRAYPINGRTRPGSGYPYLITYTNVGTTVLSPEVTFNYDNNLETYLSSSNASVSYAPGKLSLSETNLSPFETRSFTANFLIKLTDTINSKLYVSAIIAANNAIDSTSFFTRISNSYDPNDKAATVMLTPQDVEKGKSINYTVHFQNTGNDTAFNIVIADTLSNLLDAGSVQVINASKACKATVEGNIIYFEFLNVNLPDSNRNEPGSHGLVDFTVKPLLSSITTGFVPNTASIYFDYNSPVVTNTVTTLIRDTTGIIPVKLLSFNAFSKPGNNTVLLYWNTASEINTAYFVVEESTDGIHFTGDASVSSKGNGNHSYSYSTSMSASFTYYRLRIVDINGNYSYSAIIKTTLSKQPTDIIVLTNPAKEKLVIRVDATSLNNTSARLVNVEGIIVKRFTLHNGIQTIDVNTLTTGLYYIQTTSGTERVMINK